MGTHERSRKNQWWPEVQGEVKGLSQVSGKVTSSSLSRISPSHLFCRSAISRSFCVFSLTIGNLHLARDLENSYRAVVADIRHSAVSMYRPELSKRNFCELLAREGFEYLHVPQWDVPRAIRAQAIEAGTREPIWEWYDENVVGPFFARNLHRFLTPASNDVYGGRSDRVPSSSAVSSVGKTGVARLRSLTARRSWRTAGALNGF